MQWHPLFAELLRPLVESYYEVQTNLAVSDVPREADLVLLRRTAPSEPPFRGLWRHLTRWNVLEFKGPTVSARVADLDLLIELGLGIQRRLNEEGRKRREPLVERPDVSFWYLANHLGRRFLRDAAALLGGLQEVGAGVWRVPHLGRTLFLVSNRDVPVERDSVPVHLLVREPVEATRALAQEVASQADLWAVYSGWLATMFPGLWEEVKQMASRAKRGPILDFRPIIEKIGLDEFVRQVGLKRMIEEMGLKQVIQEVGLKQVIQEVGLKEVIKEAGAKQVIDEMGMDELVSVLTPAERKELLKRLK
jgi:hypothetical protein